MTNYLGVELERQRRRDLDKVAAEGARRRRWELEAREARSGKKKGAVEGPVLRNGGDRQRHRVAVGVGCPSQADRSKLVVRRPKLVAFVRTLAAKH